MTFDIALFVQKLAELQQFIVDPQQLLEGIVVDHHGEQSTLLLGGGKAVSRVDNPTPGIPFLCLEVPQWIC
jgi:hypothetical protein